MKPCLHLQLPEKKIAFRFLLLAAALFAGLVHAAPVMKKVHIVGLDISNWDMTLNYTNAEGDILFVYASSLSEPSLFGDPPNVMFTDSPAKFLMTLLKQNRDNPVLQNIRDHIANAAENGEEIGLYVGAAGHDAAIKVKLKNGGADTGLVKSIEDSYASAFGGDFVSQLQAAGCFQKENKAWFHLCSFRQILLQYLGYDFDESTSFIQQDTTHIGLVAQLLAGSVKSTASSHYLLHSTTLAQPYALKNGKVLKTASWMDDGVAEFGITRNGGLYETGYRLAKKYAALYDSAREANPELTPDEFLRDIKDPLILSVLAMLNSEPFKDAIKAGSRQLTAEQAVQRLYVKRYPSLGGLVIGKGFINFGQLLVGEDWPDQQATDDAREIINRVRGSAFVNLALYLGLIEPAMDSGADLLVVGESAQWLAQYGGKKLNQVFHKLIWNHDFLQEAYDHYSRLNVSDFETFNRLNKAERAYYHLTAGYTRHRFKNWLHSLSSKIPATHIHFTPITAYRDYVAQAFLQRYLQLTR